MGIKSYKNFKKWEQKSRNKKSKHLGTKVKKIRDQIQEQKLQKSGNKNYKNLGIKNYKNTGTKITKIREQK
jgi:hypothetical protein